MGHNESAMNRESACACQDNIKGAAEDPMALLGDVRTKVKTIWMKTTYPFARFGSRVSIHYSCEIRRSASSRMSIGDSVYVAPEAWLTVPEPNTTAAAILVIGDRCKIGRRCMISAKNSVRLEEDVLLGPAVLITDHSHQFADPDLPIHQQGLTRGGVVRIERNSWLGYGAAIICTTGELVVGRNSIVGANSVVTASIPPYCVVAGNPARVIKRYNACSGKWTRVKECDT